MELKRFSDRFGMVELVLNATFEQSVMNYNELRMREALTTHGYFYSSNVDCLPQAYIERVPWEWIIVGHCISLETGWLKCW